MFILFFIFFFLTPIFTYRLLSWRQEVINCLDEDDNDESNIHKILSPIHQAVNTHLKEEQGNK